MDRNSKGDSISKRGNLVAIERFKGMCPRCEHWIYWTAADRSPRHCGDEPIKVQAIVPALSESPSTPGETVTASVPKSSPPAGALPYGMVWVAALVFFLLSHSDELHGDGGFICIIGGVVLAFLSANMLSKG